MAEFENPQGNLQGNNTVEYDVVKTFTLSFSFLFGPPIHGYTIWLIFSTGRIVCDFLHLSLSVAEIIISLTSILYVLVLKFPVVKPLLNFSIGLLTTTRPLFQCLICFERYLAVVHPVIFLKYKHLRYKVMCSAAACIITVSSCVFTLFTVTMHQRVYMYGLVFQFFLFLSGNLFCCLAVLRVLKQSGPGERGKEKEENRMKAKAFQRILLTTVTVLVLYIPTIIIGSLYVLSDQDVSNFTSVSFSCLIMAGFVQPILYLNQHGKLDCFCTKLKMQP